MLSSRMGFIAADKARILFLTSERGKLSYAGIQAPMRSLRLVQYFLKSTLTIEEIFVEIVEVAVSISISYYKG